MADQWKQEAQRERKRESRTANPIGAMPEERKNSREGYTRGTDVSRGWRNCKSIELAQLHHRRHGSPATAKTLAETTSLLIHGKTRDRDYSLNNITQSIRSLFPPAHRVSTSVRASVHVFVNLIPRRKGVVKRERTLAAVLTMKRYESVSWIYASQCWTI
ncbi:hypothetical protein OUZ56_021966 [Daphnia magna]|uniref:Uncharacterized protein n=1 Tax=Daphnia magna TaxID=35525 RepID=A0ABR0AUZ5_9CRUS|nr:hypothetical protein OUZ56_021966 [Daphnia magna]